MLTGGFTFADCATGLNTERNPSYFLSSQLQLVLPLECSLHWLQLRLSTLFEVNTVQSYKLYISFMWRAKAIALSLTRVKQHPPVATSSCFSMSSRLREVLLWQQAPSRSIWTDRRLIDWSCSERQDTTVMTDDSHVSSCTVDWKLKLLTPDTCWQLNIYSCNSNNYQHAN